AFTQGKVRLAKKEAETLEDLRHDIALDAEGRFELEPDEAKGRNFEVVIGEQRLPFHLGEVGPVVHEIDLDKTTGPLDVRLTPVTVSGLVRDRAKKEPIGG